MDIEAKLTVKLAWQRSELKAMLVELAEKALRYEDHIDELLATEEWHRAAEKKRSIAKLESALDELQTASLENWEATTQQA